MYEITYKHLLAEKNTLEAMIANAKNPKSMSVLSLKSRLGQILAELDGIRPTQLIKKAVITFRGLPVNGSQSIDAEFSAKVLDGLNDVIASISASNIGLLGYHGIIPNKSAHALQITGMAVGSFGFELALPLSQDDLIDGQVNDTGQTIKQLQSLIRLGIDGGDEEIGDMLEQIHPRAIVKINDFLQIISRHGALFALQFENNTIRLNSDEQLYHIIKRLSSDNIKESEGVYQGKFKGLLPNSRSFEFESVSGELVKGKIDQAVKNPDIINQEYLNIPISVKLHTTQFGNSKPKYRLLDINSIQSLECVGL